MKAVDISTRSDKAEYTVSEVEWRAGERAIRAVRTKVFVEEQSVPETLEWDGLDESSRHVMAVAADGTPIGTGRLLRDGYIGRMAVIEEWRGRGVGSALLELLLEIAGSMGFDEVRLHAQTHAVGFYARQGFKVEGEEFMEAGIPHVVMSRKTIGTV